MEWIVHPARRKERLMLDLNDLYFFVQVVDKKGFSAASRALGVPKSSLSRRIITLEARLGTRLIQRTSRSFAMTDAGQEVYQHALGMMVEAEAAENAVRRRLAEPSGTVRYTCSIGIARHMVELVTRFLSMFPKVSIVQRVTNRFVDLVEEGFDVGVRGHSGALPDSSLVQRPLARTPWHLFAAPIYLDCAGTPISPADLATHAGLALGSRSGETSWKLRSSELGEVVVPFAARLKSDDMETLKHTAVAGLGIVALPAYVCRADIERGSLRCVLSDWTAGDSRITLLIPSRRGLLPSVRAFVDFLSAEFPMVVAA
jgi:DNA-binding transcriptional LysR family regulator